MNTAERIADVLVVGGGPAGLLLAGKLGNHLNVCLLERNVIGQTSKFWLTTDTRLFRHNLLETATYRTSRATIGSFQSIFAYAEGNFTAVNEKVLFDILKARCTGASVELIENTKVLNITTERRFIVVQTTNGSYRARLVVDASGGSSPFAATFRLHKLEGFYSIYGAHLTKLSLVTQDVIGAHVVHFGYPAPLFEVIPTSPSSAFCVVFFASKSVIEPMKLRNLFDEHVQHNPFFKIHEENGEGKYEAKMGVIPIGRAARKTIPGILPVGEAGLLQSPLLGAAFNELLDHADLICQTITDDFSRHREGIITPIVKFPMIKSVNDSIQLALARRLVDGSLASFNQLVEFMRKLGPTRAYRLFCTQLRWTDLPFVIKAGLARSLE